MFLNHLKSYHCRLHIPVFSVLTVVVREQTNQVKFLLLKPFLMFFFNCFIFGGKYISYTRFKIIFLENFPQFKGRDRLDMVVELKVKYCREQLLDSYLIQIRHFSGVQFLNKSAKSFVIYHQLFQSAEATFFTILK